MAQARVRQHDSPLGHWRFARSNPAPPLAGLVDRLWYVEGRADYGTDRMLPLGLVELVINLGEPLYLLGQPARGGETPGGAPVPAASVPTETLRDAWVAGVRQEYIVTASSGNLRMLGVCLHAAGASRLFGTPMHEIAGRVVDLDLVLGAEVRALRERMLAARDLTDVFALAESWLLRRLASQRALPPGLWWALRRLERPGPYDASGPSGPSARSAPSTSIGDLGRSLGLAPARLIALFRDHAGLPPKAMQRIYRFRNLLDRAMVARRPDWAALSLECGYSDQAHMCREFRAMSGCSPNEYVRKRIPACESVVVT